MAHLGSFGLIWRAIPLVGPGDASQSYRRPSRSWAVEDRVGGESRLHNGRMSWHGLEGGGGRSPEPVTGRRSSIPTTTATRGGMFSKLIAANGGGHPHKGMELKGAFLDAGFADPVASFSFDCYTTPSDVAFSYGVAAG